MVVIAIDGPSGAGKSSVARRVARRLGFDHLDTGATYRAAALAALRSGADLDDEAAVVRAVEAADLDYEEGRVLLDGEDVTAAARSPEVTSASSRVARLPAVRERVVAVQRAWVARHGDSVVEGRDIGTVVFPDAAVKVFLTARPEVRVARRARDAEAAGVDRRRLAAELAERDRRDSTRAVAPLRPAPDAVVVDTSDLGLDEVVDRVLGLVEDAATGPDEGA